MLLSSGFTDDLFPAAETLRFATLVKRLYPKVPLKLMYIDYGHMRGQNKPADTARLKTRINAWIDHYVMGAGKAPKQDVTVLTQTCPERREVRRARTPPPTGPSCTPASASCAPTRRRPSPPTAVTRT